MSKRDKALQEDEGLSWTDAWIFASLEAEGSRGTTLTTLIARADMLNHAIPTAAEIRLALRHLYAHGLVDVDGRTIRVAPPGRRIYANGLARRGGLFSIVDNMEKALRSPRFKHKGIARPADLSFVTAKALAQAWAAYHRMVRTGAS
jgi:hypothetical protein